MAHLRKATRDDAAPQVILIAPEPGPSSRGLDLPGNVAAWYEAPIYAQVSGYIRRWNTDYGAVVRRGETLATIDTPYLDQQFKKAQANLAVAQAHYKLAVTTAARWQSLAGTQAVAQQQVDVYAADAEAQKANVDAERYNVQRFAAQEAFKTLVAPFAGVVTARNTDIGDYVSAGAGGFGGISGGDDAPDQSGRPNALFRVADTHELRLFVAVPQDFASGIKRGLKATFSVNQGAAKPYEATVITTAKAISPISRTMVVELTTPNPGGALLPGTFATVHFDIASDPSILIIPTQAMLFRADGLFVAVVDAQKIVHLHRVTAGLNLGAKVQILSGLSRGDKIVASPSVSLVEGEAVSVQPSPKGTSS
jgi:multidrug efflux pump subunit AcrA (membrane-fusion protein)